MSHDASTTDPRVLLLAPGDNVAIAKCDLHAGESLQVQGHRVVLALAVPTGHKFAFRPVARDDKIVKYGAPIGRATCDIAPGEPMHLHNVTSDYLPTYTLDEGHRFPGGHH